MFYKRILFVVLSVILCTCSTKRNSYKHLHDDFLEEQLLMLKNQAFCNCVNQAMKKSGATLAPQDASNYLQLFELDVKYFFDPNLERIVNIWNQKEYISYDSEKELYFMRCLDFYNSKELANYIDSVRNVEIKKHTN